MRKETGFEDHWRPEAVEAGLKAGKLMQGTLFVNKYHAQSEATVMTRSVDLVTLSHKVYKSILY